MNSQKDTQKKNLITNYIYAALIGMIVIACATTIAVVNAGKTSSSTNVGEGVPVSVTTFVVPMKNATVAKDYSGSELQYNDTLKQWEIHKAVDFLPSEDLNVYAAANGTISNIYTNYLEGTVIEITHANGLSTVYKSLSEDVAVSVGDSISAGTVIGKIAETMAQELNTGAHLHFEILKDGKKVDPNNYLDLGNK